MPIRARKAAILRDKFIFLAPLHSIADTMIYIFTLYIFECTKSGLQYQLKIPNDMN